MSAREAFERQLASMYQGAQISDIHEVSEAAISVPGFSAYEATIAGSAARAWASEDGVVVMFRRQNFAPILEALHFRDAARTAPARAIVDRLLWLHGTDFALVERVERGDLGATSTEDVPPERRVNDDDENISLRFVVRRLGRDDDPAILAYRIVASPSGAYRVHLHQVAPPVDDDE